MSDEATRSPYGYFKENTACQLFPLCVIPSLLSWMELWHPGLITHCKRASSSDFSVSFLKDTKSQKDFCPVILSLLAMYYTFLACPTLLLCVKIIPFASLPFQLDLSNCPFLVTWCKAVRVYTSIHKSIQSCINSRRSYCKPFTFVLFTWPHRQIYLNWPFNTLG